MKKWKTGGHRYLRNAKIEEVEVDRETEQFVTINGNRQAKHSEWAHFYDTWEEAHRSLANAIADQVKWAEQDLSAKREEQAAIAAIQKPA